MTARYWSGTTLAMLLLAGLCFWASKSWELEPGSWAGAGMGFLICAGIDFARAARAAQPVDDKTAWLEAQSTPAPDWGTFNYDGIRIDNEAVHKLVTVNPLLQAQSGDRAE